MDKLERSFVHEIMAAMGHGGNVEAARRWAYGAGEQVVAVAREETERIMCAPTPLMCHARRESRTF